MIYLGVGTNVGDRLGNIRQAVVLLGDFGVRVLRVAPIFETAAFLPVGAKVEWNKPYLNTVLEVETELSPFELLKVAKKVEEEMESPHLEKWAPRVMDIDIILFNDEAIDTEELKIPHAEFSKRAFVLDPLSHLIPGYKVSGFDRTVLQMAHENLQHQPVVMGIVNVAPDSFSGKGYADIKVIESLVDEWEAGGVQFIDFGAEATNAFVNGLLVDQEIGRLSEVFELVKGKKHDFGSVLFSIDTYHPETAEKALEAGFSVLNDVTGLKSEKMAGLARDFEQVVAMHSLGVPVRRDVVVESVLEVEKWLESQVERWVDSGLDLERIVFDPGLGFGKDANQSLQLMQDVDSVNKFGFRNLLGHSRKSFMNGFVSAEFAERDAETLGLSLSVKNFDFVRVHNPLMHKRALLAKMHGFGQFF